jgi:hypothetical protein
VRSLRSKPPATPIARTERTGKQTLLRAFVALVLLAALAGAATAKTVAIGTSGGDQNTVVDEWRQKNVQKFCKAAKGAGADECHQAYSKAQFKKRIQDAVEQLECGDNLVLFFNGHGDKSKGFVFDKEGHKSEDRFLKPEELLEWLGDLACCAKVHIAWHACYSGKFTNIMSQNPHVVVAVSSADRDKKAHKKPRNGGHFADYVNWRNWPDGFVSELKKGKSWAEIFQRAAQEGKADAERKGDGKRSGWKDKPQDFKRGHIEKVEKTAKGYRVTLKAGNGLVTVFVPKGKKTNVLGLSTDELVPSFDIEVSGEALFTKDSEFKVTNVHVAKFDTKFHVIEVDEKRGLVKIEYVMPKGLKGAVKRVKVDKLPEGIEYCQWYTATAHLPREGSQTTVKDLKKSEAEPGYTVQPRPAPPPPPKAGIKLTAKVQAKAKTKSGTQNQWMRFFTVTAGDTDVHDIHVELTTPGAKFVGSAPGPKGWGDGKISNDGRSITFDKGTGKPIKAGEKSKITFTTLEQDVHFDWYFTDEKKQKITDAEGEQLGAVFDSEKRAAVRVDMVTPGAATGGSVVTVAGHGFGNKPGGLEVVTGGAEATMLQVTDDEILAVVPDTASGMGLIVSRAGDTSNAFPFRVVPSLSTNLSEPLAVTRGGVAEVVVEVVGSEETETVQLISTDPAVATFTGTVVEETEVARGERKTVPLYGLAAGSASPFVRLLSQDPKPAVSWDPVTDPPLEELLATDQPVIVDLVPSECGIGEPVVIEGANFGEDPEAVRVVLGDQPLSLLEATPERIVALVPEDGRSGSLQVYRDGQPAYKEARLEVGPSIRMSVSQETVKRGRRTVLTTAIVGTDEPQEVDVYCPTPALATFEDGAIHRRVVTSGGSPNQASLPVQTHQVGRFQIKGIIRGEPVQGNRWLELEPEELALAPSDAAPISVTLVEQVNGQWRRETILPHRILLMPEAGTATREGILDAGEPGEHLVLIEAGGLQAVFELVIDSAN